jgi:hypothetical protein
MMPVYAIVIVALIVIMAAEALAIWILSRDVAFWQNMLEKEKAIGEGWFKQVCELEKEIRILKREE